MRSNIETIKFTGAFSFLFAVLTYIVTLNIEIGFFQPNWRWMSNSFALTVCGGAFTSFMVVLLCEVQKYRSNKQSCENYLYTQTEYLYCMLYLISRNVDEYVANQSMPVTDNLLDERLMMIRNCSAAIRSVDYLPFCKNNNLMIALEKFKSEQLVEIDYLANSENFFKSAFLQAQINNVVLSGHQGTVTSANEYVAEFLAKLQHHLIPALKAVSAHLEVFDQECNNRFGWKKQEAKIHEGYVSLSMAREFEDYPNSTEEKT